MKILRFVMLFMVTALLSVVSGSGFAMALDVSPMITIPTMFAVAFIPMPHGVTFMAVQKEIWTDYIISNLFKNNEFLNNAVNEDQYVLQGKVVHIPQAGNPSQAKRNRTQLPATVTLRSDIDITYALDEYTTDPRLITAAEKVELSYNKIDSVMSDDMAYLRELVAEWMLYHWRPQVDSQILRTSGSSTAAHVENATGNRKLFTIADLRAAKVKLNKQNIPLEDRFAIIDAEMMDQLTSALTAGDYRDFSSYYDAKTGVVGMLESFKLQVRSTVMAASNASTPVVVAPDGSIPTTGNGVALCYQKNAVARAMGTVQMFDKTNDPSYYGDLYSFLLRMGGRKRRNDNKGIVGIIQAAI